MQVMVVGCWTACRFPLPGLVQVHRVSMISDDERKAEVSDAVIPYAIGSVTSADGTTIGYRQLGSGPGVVIWHGGMRASQDYMRLAKALADRFTVYVPDRRGRGMSGPHGDNYSIAKECQDIEAQLAATGAQSVFGHSSGGLAALQAALTLPSIRKLAVYEPPLSLHGSAPIGWLPRYEREITQGKLASALCTVFKGMGFSRVLSLMPRWLLLPFFALMLKQEKPPLDPHDVSISALIPTQGYDVGLVREMDGSLDSFAAMRAEVLLLGGAKSPAFLRQSLDALAHTLPHVHHIEYPRHTHDGPIDGDPERVANDLRAFFGQPA
jgi:pimeloyl-ACP methyl ester carboxylesterase